MQVAATGPLRLNFAPCLLFVGQVTASDAYPLDYFGGAVDVLDNWAVVGAPFTNKGVPEVQAITTKGAFTRVLSGAGVPCPTFAMRICSLHLA